MESLWLHNMGGNCVYRGLGQRGCLPETICKKVGSATVTKRRQKSDSRAARRNQKQTQLTQRPQRPRSLSACCCQYKTVFPGKDSRPHISVIAQEITCQHIVSEHKGQDNCPKFCQPKVPVIWGSNDMECGPFLLILSLTVSCSSKKHFGSNNIV